MSYKIRIPSTNSDTVGRFAVTAGTPDSIITFPNENGEVATTSDIPVVTTPPATIRKTLVNDFTNATTVLETVSELTTTGLEANYLYRVGFWSEFRPTFGDTYRTNLKIAFLTAGGNSGESVNTDLLHNATGGLNAQHSSGIFYGVFYPVDSSRLLSTGWFVRESTSHGSLYQISVQCLWQTGTTSDSRSFRIDAALISADPNGSIEFPGDYTGLIIEPIKSLA